MATKELNKDSAAQIYLTAVVMSYFLQGGLNTLGQQTGNTLKFLIKELGIDEREMEKLLLQTLADAGEAFPKFIQKRDEEKRRKKEGK